MESIKNSKLSLRQLMYLSWEWESVIRNPITFEQTDNTNMIQMEAMTNILIRKGEEENNQVGEAFILIN